MTMRGAWRYITTTSGAPYAMTTGPLLKLKLCAESLASQVTPEVATVLVISYAVGVADGGNLNQAPFGGGSGHIWLDEVMCEGSEYFLHQCNHDNFGINNCDHNEDAGVICQCKLHCCCHPLLSLSLS